MRLVTNVQTGTKAYGRRMRRGRTVTNKSQNILEFTLRRSGEL